MSEKSTANYFPAFLKLESKRVLLVGGGNIAYEKLSKLLDFTDKITIIAPQISQKMASLITQWKLDSHTREYQKGDIEGCDIVVVAVDDITLQKEIYEESQNSKCLCNAVDSVEYCDFIFPSYIKEGDLTVAISTSGASPAFAKHFKEYLKGKIPQNIAQFLQEMKRVRSELPKGAERMRLLEKRVKDFMAGLKT